MTIEDYEAIIELFQQTSGVTVRDADSQEATAAYLKRNLGFSFVATANSTIIGCVMCGHDGRRGYMQHLVVQPAYRKQGIGQRLFASSLQALQEIGIQKTHIFVFKTNRLANTFWSNKNWALRDDLNMYSYNGSSHKNA